MPESLALLTHQAVTASEFIFSHRPRHRITRHVVFWLAWWVFFALTYYFPHFWFIDWRLDETQVALTEQIGYFRFAQFVVINTFIGCIATHLFFTYPLLYILMPRFLYLRNYIAFAAGVIILTVVTIYFTYGKFLLVYNPLLAQYGIPPYTEPTEFTMFCMWTQVLYNCPTVACLAAGIKLFKHYYLKEREIEQVAKEKAKAELQLLKAQVHPHFLFNTLNNIYYFTLTSLDKAPGMIRKLGGLLQYMLNECNQPLVPMERELNMIRDYMALEKVRYGDQLNMKIEIEGNPSDKLITPLLLIPFLENSFKHGTSKMLIHPWVNLHISIEDTFLTFKLNNSKPENQSSSTHHGIGLTNVTKRLQLLYPEAHTLQLMGDLISYSVFLKLKLVKRALPAQEPSLEVSHALA
jgi:hypothetical protein